MRKAGDFGIHYFSPAPAIIKRSRALKFPPLESRNSFNRLKGIRANLSNWVTRARLNPSRRAISARLKEGFSFNSRAHPNTRSTTSR